MHCCAIYSCFSGKRNHTEDEEVSKTHENPCIEYGTSGITVPS